MAKSSGIIKIEGTIEDLTFYKKDGKNFVRKKASISKERIANNRLSHHYKHIYPLLYSNFI